MLIGSRSKSRHDLIPTFEIIDFSATNRDQYFVLMAAGGSKHEHSHDIDYRYFSSSHHPILSCPCNAHLLCSMDLFFSARQGKAKGLCIAYIDSKKSEAVGFA